MQELIINEKRIEDMIYEIRGRQVMLDSDLAKLYECKNGTKTINQSVSRHLDRFPDDFYFQLTDEEYYSLRSQLGTLKNGKGQHKKYLPYVFTEEGVAMLATILRTEVASKMSIAIMRAFVEIRHYIGNNEYRISNIETKIIEHDSEIKLLQETFNKLEEKRKVNEIYFNGQIYDAYSKIKDILNEAKLNIVIIDGYVDKSLLDMIKDINVNITLITKSKTKLTSLDITKYNRQYNNLSIVYNDTYHDRYIIIDRNKIYHLGASINHAGNKTFSINILEDEFVIKSILDKIKEMNNERNSN